MKRHAAFRPMQTPSPRARRVLVLALAFGTQLACESTRDHHEYEREGEPQAPHDRSPLDSNVVELGVEALGNIVLRTATVERRSVAEALELPAEIEPDPDRIAHITPLVASQVTEVKVRPGDVVERGQTLALLTSVQLGEARAEVAQAKAALDVARDQLARQEQLKAAGIGAERSYVEAQGAVKQAQAALSAAAARASVYGGSGGSGSTTVLRSPLAGTVVERHATAGEIATPDSQLFVIANIDTVWAVGRAYETDLGKVRVGASVRVHVKAHGERSWEGRIDHVSPTLMERTRTAEVRVQLANADGALKPGMFASILSSEEPTTANTAALAVPAAAVQRDGTKSIVFVQLTPNRFERRLVVVGRRGSEFVEVKEGLSEGETVVAEGAFILKSEAEKHQMGEHHH